MKVVLSPKAVKYLERLNEPLKSRIKNGLSKLEKEPQEGDIKALSVEMGFRLRIGNYRVLFGIKGDKIIVTDIIPRGGAYKRR